MTGDASADVIDNLREALKNRGMKLTDLSAQLSIPYRSLQNYFSKRSDMPLNVYIRICAAAHIPPQYPIFGLRFKLDLQALKSALVEVLGERLPAWTIEADGMHQAPPPDRPRDYASLRRDASTTAVIIESRYEMELERDMQSPWNEE